MRFTGLSKLVRSSVHQAPSVSPQAICNLVPFRSSTGRDHHPAGIKEFQSDEQVRRAMDAASPEDWTPQQRAIVASASSDVLGASPELAEFSRRLRESKPGKPAPVTQVVHKLDMSDFIKRMEQMEIDKERGFQAIRDASKSDTGRPLINVSEDAGQDTFGTWNISDRD